MRVLSESSWCFCNGGGDKSERLKASIFSYKSAAMATLSSSAGNGGEVVGTGFLIHRSLLLTTHVNVPSASAAESTEIRLQNGVVATLVPHRFFVTSSVLDLTIVGIDTNARDTNCLSVTTHHHPHYLKISPKPNLGLGTTIYLLGYAQSRDLTIDEGKVIIATDTLIKLSTDGGDVPLSPGSAGFDSNGNLAFMVCDPMKLATSSPNTKSSSTSTSSTMLCSSSWKKDDLPLQFGVPMPVIYDWLNQHWKEEGSLDDNKPKLPPPPVKLVSSGQNRSTDHFSSVSLLFKSGEGETELTCSSSLNMVFDSQEPGSNGSPFLVQVCEEGDDNNKQTADNSPRLTHVQEIHTPEIYDQPKVPNVAVPKKDIAVSILNISFPSKDAKFSSLPQPAKSPVKKARSSSSSSSPPEAKEKIRKMNKAGPAPAAAIEDQGRAENLDVSSTGSVSNGNGDGTHSEVQSSSPPVEVEVLETIDGQNNEVETMYSAETAESRNYPSSRKAITRFRYHQPVVGRSQSCVNHNRRAVHKYPTVAVARKPSYSVDKQRSFNTPRKTYSGGVATPRRGGHDYYSTPTVSSLSKKRSNIDHLNPVPVGAMPVSRSSNRVRHGGGDSSPRWMF